MARHLPDEWLAVIRAANAMEQCSTLLSMDKMVSAEQHAALEEEYTGLARRWNRFRRR